MASTFSACAIHRRGCYMSAKMARVFMNALYCCAADRMARMGSKVGCRCAQKKTKKANEAILTQSCMALEVAKQKTQSKDEAKA